MEYIYSFAIDSGYEVHSVISFWDEVVAGIDSEKKYFISRHDIDTDLKTTEKIFNLEQKLGVKSSFYFRLSTMDYSMMSEIDKFGSESSYHFEEIATLAKKYNWDKGSIDLNVAQKEFEYNLLTIKQNANVAMRSVCSHGDFANRLLGVVNHKLLDDKLRTSLGIELETYDEKFMKHVSSRHSDTHYPEFFKPGSPVNAIREGVEVVYMLTHPRHWCVNRWVNTVDNFNRVKQGFLFKC